MSMKFILPLALMATASVMLVPASADAASETRVYKWHTFNDWDVNNNGYIETREYEDYAFALADADRDGRLQPNEWETYTRTFYDPWDVGYNQVTYYDTDNDGVIERKEFKRFVSTDSDRSLYRVWDYDRDKRIGREDWKEVTTYYTRTVSPPAVIQYEYND